MNTGKDMFADIASLKIDDTNRDIVELKPIKRSNTELPLSNVLDNVTSFTPLLKMNTQEQLNEELKEKKKYYKKFISDIAPELDNYRTKEFLTTFNWRIAEDEDKKNFNRVLSGEGKWQEINVPHYGAPLGEKTTYYRTTFICSSEMMNHETIYICFNGVDYKGAVLVNGSFVGAHEGFFAPFEFDIKPYITEGENTLVVQVDNDFTMLESVDGSGSKARYGGDKIFAATGLGYDEPTVGWHHCPAGMGIYQDVYLEGRSSTFIHEVFVRPCLDKNQVEVWIEVFSKNYKALDFELSVSIFGQNFEATVVENCMYEGIIDRQIGFGDSLEETKLKASGLYGKPIKLSLSKGLNFLKVPINMDTYRLWTLESPWLYQGQITLLNNNKEKVDTYKQHFGMRSFTMETESIPKGNFKLNGEYIRLRGANTMGHLQNCVLNKNWDQLIEDILLAKICNMNFIRLTQRPVQREIYEYCDKLGLLLQTDLPLFGKLRTNQYCEALRQVEEMEKLIRPYPSSIIGSYVNEPFPNGDNKPHRYISKKEFENFFDAANNIIAIYNPDRVMKHVDGDYDPPTTSFPDNHCYNVWYNGNGVDIGKQSKGYWIPIKEGWNYGCGEFGAEGLEPVDFMKRRYPKSWLPDSDEDQSWTPAKIIGAQTGSFHYCYFETPKTINKWVSESRKYQGEAIKKVTDCFRRDPRMVSCAIHLFIDAWPAGWMKTIMDQDRVAKPAYFAYKESLTPLMVSLRTDNYKYMAEDTIQMETWICNDTSNIPKNAKLKYFVTIQNDIERKVISSGEIKANVPNCSSICNGLIKIKVPKVEARKMLTVHLALVGPSENVIHDTSLEVEVYPQFEEKNEVKTYICGQDSKILAALVDETHLVEVKTLKDAKIILVNDYKQYQDKQDEIDKQVKNGATLVGYQFPSGTFTLCGHKFNVKVSSLLPLHLASRDTNHKMVQQFRANDFRQWYDAKVDYITPFLSETFESDTLKPILTSGNTDQNGNWKKVQACGEAVCGQGKVVLCQIDLVGRTKHNPVAKLFSNQLFN